jgi:hypothetical protein
MTIVSYPKVYELFIKNAGWLKLSSGGDFLSYLFIDITKLMQIEDYNDIFKIHEDKNVIRDYSKRDTIIYNLHKPGNKITNLMFVYMLSKILANAIVSNDVGILYETPQYLQILDDYSELLSKNFDSISGAYKTLVISKRDTIAVEYEKIVKQYNKIYSFVRIGKRTKDLNPRYKYSEFVNFKPAFLKLDYINTDKTNTELASSRETPEKYIFGMYDGIYSPGLNNKSISDDFFNRCLWDGSGQILKNNICVIGIGQSGSGKTSSLISFNNKNDGKIENGILIEALNNPMFKGTYKTITLTITEILLDPDKTPQPENIDTVTEEFYKTKEACKTTTYKIGTEDNWKLEPRAAGTTEERKALENIGNYIVWVMDNKRLIHPTPNNPVSSRSHMVICLNCIPDKSEEAKNIIFLDLAGNENEFECNKPAVIVKFYEKYMMEKDQTKLKQVFVDGNLAKSCSIDKIDTIKETASTIAGSNDKIYTINTNASTMDDYIGELDRALAELKNLQNDIKSIEKISKFLNDTKVKPVLKTESVSLMKYLQSNNMPYFQHDLFRGENKTIDATQKNTYDDAIKYIRQLDNLWKEYMPKNTSEIIIMGKNGPPTPFGAQLGVNKESNYLKLRKDTTFTTLMKQIYAKLNELLTTKSPLKSNTFDTITAEIIEKIVQRKEEIDCDMPKLQAIAEECKKRRYEGFMINRSIRDMIKEIKSLMRVKLIREYKKNNYMPLCFETQIYETCLDPLKDQKIYDTFYDIPKTDTENSSSIILRTIRSKKVDLLNLDFVVFTIINVSDTTNNPPDPPFVNINDLIKHTHIIKNDSEMEKAFNIVVEKLQKYNFYYPKSGKTYIDQIKKIMAKPEGREDALIEFINNVNQTTLIGTLESSDKLKHYIFNDIPCLITENTGTRRSQAGGKHQFIEDSNHMIDQNRHVSTRKKQSSGSKRTRKSNKDYRYS